MSNWIIRTSPADVNWQSICYGNGIFVAVSSGGEIMTSDNGVTDWTLRTCPVGTWMAVCYGEPTINSVSVPTFVAVSYANTGNSIMTSEDGITWTGTTVTNNPGRWTSVCYGNQLFVAANDLGGAANTSDSFMTSDDGTNWSLVAAPINNRTWKTICFGNNLFVATATSNFSNEYYVGVAVSTNGTDWKVYIDRYKSSSQFIVNSIINGNGVFVAVLTNIGVVLTNSNVSYSSNTDWTKTELTDAFKLGWQSVCYGNGLFVAVANTGTGTRAMTSPDGINWTLQTTHIDNSWQSVCYGEFSFVAVSNSGTENRVMTSESPSLTCYLIGTKILCLIDNLETYVPIEDIRKGTLVKTYKHGYIPVKLIGKRNCMNNPKVAQNCLYKMKETGLSITGAHSILVDTLPAKLIEQYEFYTKNHKLEDKYILLACDSDLFTPSIGVNEYTLYHLCLESDSTNDHFGIWADGVLSESTSENDYNSGFFVNTG